MKFILAFLTLGVSISAYSQICQIDMVDRYNRVVRNYTSYDAQSGCVESLKECRKAIRLDPQLGGVDCLRVEHPIPAPGPNHPDVSRMDIVDQAAAFALNGCYVIKNVDGWAHQIYINGAFRGNYDGRTYAGEMNVRSNLANALTNGTCRPRTAMELRYMRDPNLVADFANFRYRGCHVRMDVGQYHQVYVGNTFKGNYDKVTEYLKLKNYLVNLLIQGQCRY